MGKGRAGGPSSFFLVFMFMLLHWIIFWEMKDTRKGGELDSMISEMESYGRMVTSSTSFYEIVQSVPFWS